MDGLLAFFGEVNITLPSWFIFFFILVFVLAVFLFANSIFLRFKIKQFKETIIAKDKVSEKETQKLTLKTIEGERQELFLKTQADALEAFRVFLTGNTEHSEADFIRMAFRSCKDVYPQIRFLTMISCEKSGDYFFEAKSGENEIVSGEILKSVETETEAHINIPRGFPDNSKAAALRYLNGTEAKYHVFVDELMTNGLASRLCFLYGFETDEEPELYPGFFSFLNIAASFITFKKKYLANQEAFEKQLIFSMVKILEVYDPFIKGHSENVARYASVISEGLNLNNRDRIMLYWSSQVHDIGKIMVPSTILRKAGRYTAQEYEILKNHAKWGGDILSASQELNEIAAFVRHHHERWDGKGYPDGIKGEEIPLFSRIIAIADTYDNFTNDKSFREGMTPEQALEEMRCMSGTVFDPQLLKIFINRIV